MSSGTDESTSAAHSDSEAESNRFDWETATRNTLLVLVTVALIWLVFNVDLPPAQELREKIAAWGWAAWLVFIGAYAVVAITPIPVTVMAVAAGLLFGVVEGTILSVVGVLMGCWGGYWLARALGRPATVKLLGSRARTVERHLDEAGFQAVLVLRLLPGFPYWPVNYGSGAFGVSQRDFILASAVAIIPGQISLVSIGGFISTPTLLNGLVVGIAWLVVIGLTIWAYRKWKAARPEDSESAT